ncbi:glutathione S-transferase kappa 1-like [Panonychus citri]|uniref:glutathione S-transferase kappa 1-like n=1 Tax=Panonychus citri TaxID=50023 RepID=UPI002307BB32|nr:glutathione S-transferase kappa 1-like [Panonychus citri]
MALTKFPVTFFYDVLSPYSYIGFELMTRYNKIWTKMDLQLKPCSIFHIFKEADNKAPMTVPRKAAYLSHDLNRISKMSNIPFGTPSNFLELAFGSGSTPALKFLCAADALTQSKATENLSRQIFKRVFTNNPGLEISSPKDWLEAGKAAGIDESTLNEIIIQCEKPQFKAKLISNTKDALGFGAFGAPSTVVHSPDGPILLFGSDRIELLAHLIGEKYIGPDPLSVQSKL